MPPMLDCKRHKKLVINFFIVLTFEGNQIIERSVTCKHKQLLTLTSNVRNIRMTPFIFQCQYDFSKLLKRVLIVFLYVDFQEKQICNNSFNILLRQYFIQSRPFHHKSL